MVMEKMVIAGFYGPYRATDQKRNRAYDHITREIYELIRGLGINLILFNDNDYTTDREDVIEGLKYAAEYGIGVYIRDKRLCGKISGEQRLTCLSDYTGYEAFKGIALVDEPFTSYYDEVYKGCSQYEARPERRMESYAKISSFLNQFPNICGNINLLPMIAYLGGEDYVEDYGRYLDEFIATCRPKVLSFDYYVFAAPYAREHGIEGYFANLSIIREKALEHGLEFWNFVQAGANSNDLAEDMAPTVNDVPNRGQLLWNVNTSLAYGAKGIEYFTLIQPYYYAYETGGGYDYRRNGLIGADGKPNQWYGYAKYANKQVMAIEEYLGEAVSKDIWAVGEHARIWTGIYQNDYAGTGIKDIFCSNPAEGIIIGAFANKGKPAVYIVNNDMEKAQSVCLAMKERITCREISAGLDNRWESDSCQVSLQPGEAVLLIFG